MNIKLLCPVKNEINAIRHEMNRIQSKGHNIGNYKIKKVPLSSYDNNKEYMLQEGQHRQSFIQNGPRNLTID